MAVFNVTVRGRGFTLAKRVNESFAFVVASFVKAATGEEAKRLAREEVAERLRAKLEPGVEFGRVEVGEAVPVHAGDVPERPLGFTWYREDT